MSLHPADSLRVGLLMNELDPPAWVAQIVRDIQNSDFARVELVVINRSQPASSLNWRQRWRERWQRGLYTRYKNWDRARHGAADPDAFAASDISDCLAGVPRLEVVPAQAKFVDRFSEEDLSRIRDARLDVLFRFGFRILRGEILQAARFGVWSYHHGDNREYRGSAAGFWELYERNPVTGSILQVLTENLDGGQVLYRSWSATEPGSLHASVNPMYWKSAQFAVRRLRDLHREGWDWLRALPAFQDTTAYSKPIYRTPDAPAMTKFLVRQAGTKAVARVQAVLRPQRRHWFIALRRRNSDRTVFGDLAGFLPLHSPPDRFWADPFLVDESGATFLFFEDFDYRLRRGRISWMQLEADGSVAQSGVALETPGHLSYPFVFRDGTDVFMIPETRTLRRVELYRAVRFPTQWERVRVLLDNVEAVDATLHRQDGRYWLFTNIAPYGGSSFDELHVFSACSLDAPWLPHPRNPVVSDVRRARPAGRLFHDNGRLIRPSQDCSRTYGGAIQLNEVVALTADAYAERPLHRIEPNWFPGLLGTHTYNRSRHWEVIDGLRLESARVRARNESAALAESRLAQTALTEEARG